MAKDVGKLANTYARALLRVVEKEQGSEGAPSPAQELASRLHSFVKLWRSEPRLSQAILNPMFEKRQRLGALLDVAERTGLSEIGRRFLETVFKHDRIRILAEIVEAFAGLADSRAGVVQVEVITAQPLSPEESAAVEAELKSKITGRLIISWEVNPEILGGMIVRFSGRVLDGSLSGRLRRIEHALVQ